MNIIKILDGIEVTLNTSHPEYYALYRAHYLPDFGFGRVDGFIGDTKWGGSRVVAIRSEDIGDGCRYPVCLLRVV